MNRYYTLIARIVFAVIFVAAGVVHIVLGRSAPDSYAVFSRTALVPGLAQLWDSVVMPHIGVLTLVLATIQIAAGVGLLLAGRTVQVAAWVILGFLAFIVVLGYGLPSAGMVEDLAINRLGTFALAGFILPVALHSRHRALWALVPDRR